MNNYEEMKIESDVFTTARENFDLLMQRLFASMEKNNSDEGSITLKVDLQMKQDWVPNGEGGSVEVNKPVIKHKVTISVPVSDSMNSKKDTGMNLVWDEELNDCIYSCWLFTAVVIVRLLMSPDVFFAFARSKSDIFFDSLASFIMPASISGLASFLIPVTPASLNSSLTCLSEYPVNLPTSATISSRSFPDSCACFICHLAVSVTLPVFIILLAMSRTICSLRLSTMPRYPLENDARYSGVNMVHSSYSSGGKSSSCISGI